MCRAIYQRARRQGARCRLKKRAHALGGGDCKHHWFDAKKSARTEMKNLSMNPGDSSGICRSIFSFAMPTIDRQETSKSTVFSQLVSKGGASCWIRYFHSIRLCIGRIFCFSRKPLRLHHIECLGILGQVAGLNTLKAKPGFGLYGQQDI